MSDDQVDLADQSGEQRYQHLFDVAPICIFVIDMAANPPMILEANRQAGLVYGYPVAELVGTPIERLTAPEALPPLYALTQRLRQGQTVTIESVHLRRDGMSFPVKLIVASDPANPDCSIVTVEDISAAKQRRSEADAIQAERLRMAHEIHDGVAQTLAGLRFKSALWSHRAKGAPSGMGEALGEVLAVLKTAIEDLRRSIFALRPLNLETLGFLPALTQLVSDFGDHNQLAAQLVLSGTQDALPQVYELTLFRVIQEGLNNISQHAQASSVWVRMDVDAAGGVVISLRDDGRGFDPHQLDPVDPRGHFGLRQLRERIVDRGGTVDIHSAPGKGTELAITLPPLAPEINHVTD